MGWYTVARLEVKESELQFDECRLLSRGGLEGLQIHIEDKTIHLPKNIILDLVADEYTQEKIRNYESMDTVEALIDMGLVVSVPPKQA